MTGNERHVVSRLSQAFELVGTNRDAACAGRYVHSLSQRNRSSVVLNDAACACEIIDRKYGDNITKIFRDSSHGKALIEAGFGDDLAFCAAVDSQPVVPIYQDRQITRLGPDRER